MFPGATDHSLIKCYKFLLTLLAVFEILYNLYDKLWQVEWVNVEHFFLYNVGPIRFCYKHIKKYNKHIKKYNVNQTSLIKMMVVITIIIICVKFKHWLTFIN